MTKYAYVYKYVDDAIHGKGLNMLEYLSLSSSPGIYYKYDFNGEWSVLEVTGYGTYNTLHREEVPNEVKIHHLLTK